MLKLLRSKICPEPLVNPQSIDFASPADENSDYTLGIFLYDMKENLEHTELKMIPMEDRRMKFPPHSFTTFYMFYVNASAQIGVKSLDAQKIITRAAQVLYDIRQVDVGSFYNNSGNPDEVAKLMESRLTFDEKTKIWSALNKPMQLAIYCEIAPVLISSERILDAPNVMRGSYKFGERR
ncbi:hypothetical protein FACS189481_1580 [Clostridia bacterium]|nr:hypothetical protein FACS189481_1580 [Clostridia bacterium]